RLQPGARGRVVVGLQAGADLEANRCVVEKVRSQLRYLADQPTSDRGKSSIEFDRGAGSNVYVVVSQTLSSEPGPFTLTVTGIPRPANDELKVAASISALPSTLDGTTVGATSAPPTRVASTVRTPCGTAAAARRRASARVPAVGRQTAQGGRMRGRGGEGKAAPGHGSTRHGAQGRRIGRLPGQEALDV